MLRRTKQISSGEKGQAMVEMALVLPILLLLLCGIIDFGWISFNRLSVSYCSREGARYGIVHAEDEGVEQAIEDRVLQMAPDYLNGKISVFVSFSDPASPSGGDITVQVTATVQSLTPVAGTFFSQSGGAIPLTAQCVMKVE